MICTDEAAFIHVPKTGGMSVTRFLINALDGPVVLFAAGKVDGHIKQLAATPEAAAKMRLVKGRRHARCHTAAEEIRGAGLKLPPLAFSIVREPVSLMVSYYKYMQSPKVWRQRGMEPDKLIGAPKLAMELPFAEFVAKADFYGLTDIQIDEYYQPAEFARLDVVALDHLGEYLTARFAHHAAFDIGKLERRNTSKGVKSEVEVTDAARILIDEKYPLLTQTHRKAQARGWKAG